MKKLLKSMLAISVAAFTLASCSDVEEPYQIPTPGGEKPSVEGEYLNETFASSFGSFTVANVEGTPWVIDFKTAKATGYDNTAKKTTASESYLVSKAVDLSASKSAYLQFEYILRYVSAANNSNTVLITDNYTGDPKTTTWTDITGNLTEGRDWTTFEKYSKDIPTEFIGKKAVVVALYYKCDNAKSSTIEVKNLLLKEGKAGGEVVTPETPEILNPVNGLYINETFATSFGVFAIDNMKKGTPWIIDFKTAKATGYDNAAKTTTPSESYLISKPMNMKDSKGASISFEYILRYSTRNGAPVPGVSNKVLVTDNYTGDPTTTKWTDITGTLTEGKDWNTFSKFSANIPAEFKGKEKVVVALQYACENSSSTWEVKNLTVKEGTAEENQGGNEGNENQDADVVIEGNTMTINIGKIGFTALAENPEITLKDGTKLTFAKDGGTTAPKFYDGEYASVRMYARNSLAISASKKIAKIMITTTDAYQGKTYNGNDEAYAEANGQKISIVKTDDTHVTFDKVNANAAKIVNDFTADKGGTQLRIKTLILVFAE